MCKKSSKRDAVLCKMDKSAQVVFRNIGDSDLELLLVKKHAWGEADFKALLKPGSSSTQAALAERFFRFTSKLGIENADVQVQSEGTVDCAAMPGSIVCTPNWTKGKYSGERWDALAKKTLKECEETYAGTPGDLDHFCRHRYENWQLLQCRFDYEQSYIDEQIRRKVKQAAEMNVQYAHIPHFSKLGFRKTMTPKDLMDEVRSFWLKHRLTASYAERNANYGSAVAGCQSDSWVLHMPKALKQKIHDVLKPIVADWAGMHNDQLESTMLYGLRMYRNGSKLLMHSDIPSTHVLSAIVVVGHLGLGTPDSEWDSPGNWPLKIHDHSGKEHQVPSKAGQLILYESAACLHGRPDWFIGREFVNFYVHYAPRGWDPNMRKMKKEWMKPATPGKTTDEL